MTDTESPVMEEMCNSDMPIFSYYDKKGEPKIDTSKLIEFLEFHSFSKTEPSINYPIEFLQIENNIIRKVSREEIKDFIVDWIKRSAYDVFQVFARSPNSYCGKDKLEMLSSRKIDLYQDTSESCHLYFKNALVKITGDNIQRVPHEEQSLLVWEHLISPHTFRQNNEPAEIEKFISNICNDDPKRIKALCSGIAYLIHSYKSLANAKLIVLTDQDPQEENGGTGKGIIAQIIKTVREVKTLDLKTRKQNQFIFQRVSSTDNVVHLEDLDRDFIFNKLFNAITGEMEIEDKKISRIAIPFSQSPKLMISTNFMIGGNTASYRRRIVEYELFNHYSEVFSPEDEFGHLFFSSSWDSDEWDRFFSWICRIIQDYLREGLIDHPSKNLDNKRLISGTSKEFVAWLEKNFELRADNWYNLKRLTQSYNQYISDNKRASTIKRWFDELAQIYDFEIEEKSNYVNGSNVPMILLRSKSTIAD